MNSEKRWIRDVQVDTLHEVMLNKITTLMSRCEWRDIVGRYFREKAGFQIEDCFDEARQEDGGLTPP